MPLRVLLAALLCLLSAQVLRAQTTTPDYVAHVSQESMSFGAATVNTTTGRQEFYYNDYNGNGTATLTITGPFRFCSYTSEDLGKTATAADMYGFVYLQFAPTGSGAASGALTIKLSNGATKTVPLSGTGIPLATLTASPSGIDFGSAMPGEEVFMFFTLKGTNITGDVSIQSSGPFGSVSVIPASQLTGGKSYDVGVSFYPNNRGAATGSLKLITSGGYGAPDISITVSLTGNSIPKPTGADESNAIGGAAADQQETVAEPIQLGTGSYEYSHNDIKLTALNGAFNFSRFYNSVNRAADSPMGFGWSHSFNYKLSITTDPVSNKDQQWNVSYPDGHVAAFIPQGTGSYALYIGTTDHLQKNSGGDFTLTTKNNLQYHFTTAGVLDQIIDLNGNVTFLNYNGGNLASVVSPGGRKYTLSYSGSKITSVTDPLNRTCSYTYDGSGNLQRVTDANGGMTSFTYNAAHALLTIVNPLGNTLVNNTYDANNKVIQQLDANNQATRIAYNTPSPGDATVTNPDNSQWVAHHDDSFRRTFVRDELGFTKYYGYDAYSNENSFTDENSQAEARQFDKSGNLLSKTTGGNTSSYSYNTFNSPLSVTDANGNVTNFTYDTHNNLIAIQLPDHSTQSFTYNSTGLRTAYKDGRGNNTTYAYSASGDLLTVTTPAGTKSFQYDLAGRTIAATDENGNTVKSTYDNNDNILSTTDALNHSTTFTYDANNQLLSTTDKNGNTTRFTYDKKDRLSTKTDANGGIIKYTYDARDNVVSVTDANNNVMSYAYDKKNRKTAITNSLGTAQYQYDGVGNLLKLIDAAGLAVDYTYTATNKVKTQRDGLSNTITYNYDKNDNQVSVTDPLSRTTGYTYDALNRLVAVLDAANNTTRFTYDENGNKKTVADPKGHVQTYTYNAANRLTSMLDAAGNTTAYAYDATGNITAITTPTGTIAKVYDALNRVTAITNSGGDSYSFTYDNVNNITAMTSGIGKTAMIYDKRNALVQYTDPYNNKVMYTYDAAGNKKSITYPGNKTVNYTYDKANNLATVSDWMNHTFTYTYDAGGKTIKLVYPNGIHADMAYDAAGRLTSKKNLTAANVLLNGSAFTLDATGNRLTEQRTGTVPTNLKPAEKAYAYGNDDRLNKDGVWTFVNDNAGNRISEGNEKVQWSYSFSADNRLNKVVDTLGVTSAYGYDAMGNRLSRSVGNSTNRYVVDITGKLSQVLQITDGNGAIQSQYVSGNGLLEGVDAGGNASYYLYDAQHNTAAMTDATGNVTDTYTYDPFGALLEHKGDSKQPFTFLGEYGVEQENNSVYYARARYYDAAAGRFLSKDPYPYSMDNPQTMNRYAYGLNNPLSLFDPTGLSPDDGKNYFDQLLDYLGGSSDIKACKAEDARNNIVGGDGLLYSLLSDGLKNDFWWLQKNGKFMLTSAIESNYVYARSYGLAEERFATAGVFNKVFSIFGVANAGYNLLNDRSYAHLFELGVAGLAFIPGIGWIAAGGYFIADIAVKHYTGESIAEHIVGKGYIPHLMY